MGSSGTTAGVHDLRGSGAGWTGPGAGTETPRTPPALNEARRRYLRACADGACDSDEARALLQERIALFSKAAVALSAFAFVALQVLMAGTPGHTLWRCLTDHGSGWHVLAILVSLSVWLSTRRGCHSFGVLMALDVGGLLSTVGAYGMMTVWGGAARSARVELVLMLITMTAVTLRAIVIPSTAKHTIFVSGVAMLPVLLVAYLYGGGWHPGIPASPVWGTSYVGVWCVLAISTAGLASSVIYGLRRKAALARQLGQYVLEEKIGEGGMGAVFRASHALLRRPTAVKLVLSEKAGGESLARFEREVQLTALLTHPNTVIVFDYGRTSDGIFYYAMEYLDGINLEQLVATFGPLEPARVISILEQVCGSLAEAHSIGLVHRDIKPANVILCERGGLADTAKVVDFGLVKDIGPRAGGSALSHVNTLLGTPLYMAPETLVAPERIDARADLYALGAVGYYLLTSEPPFVGTSMMEVCAKHLHEAPVPPSERVGRALPRDLEAVLLGCLSKTPEHRPESATALSEALSACNVPRWSPSQARSWWAEHGRRARSIRPKAEPRSPELLSTMAFDSERVFPRLFAK